MTTLFYTILGFVIIFFAFKFNVLLGIAAAVILLLLAFYLKLPDLYAIKGNVAYSNGKLDEAVRWYQKSVKTGRTSIKNSGVYATMLLRNGQPEEALAHLNHLLSMRLSQDIKRQLKQTRCLANYKLGDIDEALEEAEELFEDGYVTSNSYSLIGLLRLEKNDQPIEELTAFCEKAYDYDDEHRDILDNLLICYYRGGQYEKAAEIAEKLVEEHPEFIEGRCHGAQALMKLGETEKAREYMKTIDQCKRSYMTTVSAEEVNALKKELNL